jgi:hypothetical protein
VRILKGLATVALASAESKGVTARRFRPKTGKARCLAVNVHSGGLTGDDDEITGANSSRAEGEKGAALPIIDITEGMLPCQYTSGRKIVEAIAVPLLKRKEPASESGRYDGGDSRLGLSLIKEL